jgi:50S ribosomal subunit-associated GTPase HflX
MGTPLSPKTFIGEGKARELGELCSSTGANLVVFLNVLSPRQRETLASIAGVRIQDVESLGLRLPPIE